MEEEMQNQRRKRPTKWITGIISGLDGARRIFKGTQPETILSDQGLGIIGAIESLKRKDIFKGTHLFDAYHIMSNLKMQYKNKETLRQLYLAADEDEYNDIYEK